MWNKSEWILNNTHITYHRALTLVLNNQIAIVTGPPHGHLKSQSLNIRCHYNIECSVVSLAAFGVQVSLTHHMWANLEARVPLYVGTRGHTSPNPSLGLMKICSVVLSGNSDPSMVQLGSHTWVLYSTLLINEEVLASCWMRAFTTFCPSAVVMSNVISELEQITVVFRVLLRSTH
jgi:hypothetical protein